MVDVTILIGSGSDKEYAERAKLVLDNHAISSECFIASAHRTPGRVINLVGKAEDNGTQVFIGMAGLAAALPGTIAAHTELPVIGVPLDVGPLNGIDAALAIMQMPPGVPVATMAIGMAGARNAAYFAAKILKLTGRDIQFVGEDNSAELALKVF